jgi:hypothetical protein
VSLLKLLWRRLDDLQRGFGVRIALSVVVGVLVLGSFGWLYATGASLRSDARAIADVLRDANLARADSAAEDFARRGIVVLGSRTLGGEHLAREAASLYDNSGRLGSPASAAQLILRERIPAGVPRFLLEHGDTVVLLAIASLVVGLLTIWMGLVVPAAATFAAAIAVAAPFWLGGSLPWSVAVLTAFGLCFSFVLFARTAAAILGGANPTFAIASNVLREALRLRIAAFFIGALLIAIPLLPIWIDPGEPLRYQVQTFLSRSTGLLFLLAACMTVFLSCATVAFEIRDRQIWQLMTKPVARVQYLAGKWLGVVTLNVLLFVIGGIAIFVFVRIIGARPAMDIEDQVAVNEQVLVARQGMLPVYDKLDRAELESVVEQRMSADPVLMAEIEAGEKSSIDVRRELARQVATEFSLMQRTIPAGMEKPFEFHGLKDARRMQAPLTLRYTFDIGRIDPHEVHPVLFKFSEQRFIDRAFVPGQAHVVTLPPELIDENGVLRIVIENAGLSETPDGQLQKVPGIGPLIFKAEDFEILYRVDGFEPNFVRAMIVQVTKLAFLAMLGVCTATILSFPVACMLSFTVLAIGSLAPFLGMSLDRYGVKPDAPLIWQGVQWAVIWIASGSEWMLRAFGETRPTAALVEGRVVGWSSVGRTLLVIGIVWSGGIFALGYAAFRRKELAVYSGHS